MWTQQGGCESDEAGRSVNGLDDAPGYFEEVFSVGDGFTGCPLLSCAGEVAKTNIGGYAAGGDTIATHAPGDLVCKQEEVAFEERGIAGVIWKRIGVAVGLGIV